jgi:ligand-binding sensor domain-containing protein/signal transduction histidine kinase
MPNNLWIRAAVRLLFCFLPFTARAAPADFSPGHPRFYIDVKDSRQGLPQNSVIAMIQTRDGYLWLGTYGGGLARFDGTSFQPFNEGNTPGLPGNTIVFLFEDSRSNLWAGTDTGGAVLIKDGRVTSLGIGRGSREGRLVSACEDGTGAVWLYTADGQLWRYQDEKFKAYLLERGRASFCRVAIAEQKGPVWVGMDWGQSAIDPAAARNQAELPVATNLPVNLNRLDFLLASAQGGYWRLADGHVQKCRANQVVRDFGPYPWDPAQTRIASACEDREGNLVVGTFGDGVYWFDAEGKAAHLSKDSGLSNNTILSLCADREGNLWAGTDGGGLNRVRRRVFDVLETSSGLSVKSICEDGRGGLWFGTFGDGLRYWQDGTGGVVPVAEYLQGGIVGLVRVEKWNFGAVFADRDGKIWAGMPVTATNWGLFQFQNGLLLQVPGSGAITRNISAIHQDRAGRLWVGTDSGLACEDGRAWKMFTTQDGLSSDVVRAIADDAEGNLWIGTGGGGLNRWRNGRFTSFRVKDGLPSDNVSSLLADGDGVLWIGTGGGLARHHAGAWTRYTTQEGLVANSIGYLIEDGRGYLWIGSSAGLMRVPKKALNDFAEHRTTFIPCHVYGEADGLPATECSSGSQPAACRGRDGRLWFPTIKGLAWVNPALLTLNNNPPPVIIESVSIDGQEQSPNRLRAVLPASIIIPAGRERLEIQYTSPNLTAPDRAQFRYRLEGHETGWIDARRDRIARYSNLPPGRYLFHVTACNEDGVWNETGSTLAIIVPTPFWRTSWFLGASALLLLGIIVAAVHHLSTQKLQRQLEELRRQEAIEQERARIARDIHDQLGANLTQVSLLGEMIESDKGSPAEVGTHAQQICHTARDTTRALDEIVWTVNPLNDTLDGLVNYAGKYAQDYLAVAGLRYRLDVPPQLPNTPVPPDVRHNVFLAFKEAVNNVVKHAQATEVWIRLRLELSRFTLEIEDNGRGPTGMDERKNRDGLRNMRKRMEDVGGEFSIEPAAGRGTLVRLTVPIGKS